MCGCMYPCHCMYVCVCRRVGIFMCVCILWVSVLGCTIELLVCVLVYICLRVCVTNIHIVPCV
jgi:hypothetical protein